MEFSPNNQIVRLCLQAMNLESQGKEDEAGATYQMAWREARENFEKFLAAYFVARHEKSNNEKLDWFEIALQYAFISDNPAVTSAFYSLYSNLAICYHDAGDPDREKEYLELAETIKDSINDQGPFYHGTRADLKVGDYLIPGNKSNYQDDLVMNHIYFTALINGAGLAAALAKGEGDERVYIVQPTGNFENDPNVTDKKFPGNLTRSYRTTEPLEIIGEIPEWSKQTPESINEWRNKLENNKGEIIN